MRKRPHSAARYFLLDWPSFVLRSALAWYVTGIGIAGAGLCLMTLIIVILWFGFGVRWGW